ncbi:tetratricopeptide repeat protein [Psychromonas sp. MME2]|uniref:YfgM family protein n=1 Tax=unclassified Psychromonas TaxID=2614957 RepID=UPI00339CE606
MVDIIEGYETEEQQVDAIKKWWKENGNSLIIGAVVGLAGLWGWRYYNDSVIATQEQQSQAYSTMLLQFEAQNGAKDLTQISAFVNDNISNNYGILAALLLSKEAIQQQNFALAKEQLLQVQKENKFAPLNDVVNLRLARVQVELGEHEAALQTLTLIKSNSFLAKASQEKGNIYLHKGDLQQARGAFQEAIMASEGRVDPILQLQFDDLATTTDDVAAPVLE